MSFDVYFQGFGGGDAAAGGGDIMRSVLEPFAVRSESDGDFLLVKRGDGWADVYLSADSAMANHVSGTEPWQLLVEGATAAGWVILPVGCPTCITDEAQRAHLPDGLDDEVVLVVSGDDLLAVIQGVGA